jgi:hypothetical protein
MHRLTTDLVRQALRIFVSLAYPGGEAAVPARKRTLLDLPPGKEMLDHLNDEPSLRESCQCGPAKNGRSRALLIRLGCCHYPHLKLKAQLLEHEDGDLWLFSVDTHDAFSASSFLPPAGHPEAAAWAKIQAANAALKERIEAAWEQAGLMTFNALLRRDLEQARPPAVP